MLRTTDNLLTPELALRKIDVIPLDVDGSIFNTNFYNHPACKGNAIKANNAILLRWAQEIEIYQPDLVVLACFSLTFSPVLQQLCKALQQLLVKKGLQIPCIVEETPPSQTMDDSSKLLILYEQIHRLCTLHPNATIRYTPHDGSGFTERNSVQGLLFVLENFLTENANLTLIPKSVLLRLREYNGNIIRTKENRGAGEIDRHHKDTVLEMTRLAGIDVSNESSYKKEHNICAAFSGSENIERLKQLKKFISEKNYVTNKKALLTFSRTALSFIPEQDEVSAEELLENVNFRKESPISPLS